MTIEEFFLNEESMAKLPEDQLRKLLADMAERILMLENRLEQAAIKLDQLRVKQVETEGVLEVLRGQIRS